MLTLEDLLVRARQVTTVPYPDTANDISGGRPVRLFRAMMTPIYYGGHLQIWDSLTAGSGTQIKLMSMSYYPCQVDFGSTGILFSTGLSYNWGSNPYSGIAQTYTYYSNSYPASGTIIWGRA